MRTLVVVGIAVVLLLAFLGAGALGYAAYLRKSIAFTDPAQSAKIHYQLSGTWSQTYNVLVAGVDSGSSSDAYRTDTLVLLHVDPKAKRVWLLSIPRDTRYLIAGQGSKTIADAHYYSGPAGTVQAVERLTGLPVNFYMEFKLAAIQKATDAYGGVWVNVPVAVNDPNADSSPSRSAARISAGYQLLDGYHALTLARTQPTFENQTYARMADQQLVLGALGAKIEKSGNLAALFNAVTGVAPLVKTTMTLTEISDLATTMRDAGSANRYGATVRGTSRDGYSEPDAAALALLVADIRAQRPFSASATALAALAAQSPAVAASKPPSKVTVTVTNGSGISGAAKQAAGVLQTQGFPIVSTGNANQNVYPQTFVIYNSDVTLANLVAQYLPPGAKVVRGNGMYGFKSDVLVIVGKDWDLGKVPVAPIKTQ